MEAIEGTPLVRLMQGRQGEAIRGLRWWLNEVGTGRARAHWVAGGEAIHNETSIMLGTILIILLIVLLLGALPTWPYSRGWGYYPSSGLGLVLAILVILLLLGWI